MFWRGASTAGTAAILLAACGVDGYQSWWNGEKASPAPVTTTDDAGADAAQQAVDSGHPAAGDADAEAGPAPPRITSVFVILMARQSWSDISGSASAPYINGKLLPTGAHSEQYFAAPPGLGSSEPNVIWLEAGDNLGIADNSPPSANHRASTAHLVDELEASGISWKAYVDRAVQGVCPIVDQNPYRTWHVPFLFFDDVVGNPPSPAAKRCVQHVVPLAQLGVDLQNGTAPRYSFIVPDLCDDMHDDCNTGDPIKQGDDWLAIHVPPILASSAYGEHGVVFITWDFSAAGHVPLGFIALSRKARAGYASSSKLTASSTLRSIQEVFDVKPPLGDAANAPDVGDLFTSFP